MLQRNNVLKRRSRPTTKSYRDAVASIIRNLQAEHGLTDGELAERIGCSVGTIRNARNLAGNLDGVFLTSIQHEFGAEAIDPVQALSGARGVPEGDSHPSDRNTIACLAKAITKLAETQEPDSEDGADTGPKEAAQLLPILRRARAELDAEIARVTPLVMKAVGA